MNNSKLSFCPPVHPFFDKFFRPLQRLLLAVSLPEPEKSFHLSVSPFLSQQLVILPCPSLYFSCCWTQSSTCFNILICFLGVSSECVYSWGYFNCFPSASLCKHQHWISSAIPLAIWYCEISLLAFIFTIMNSTISPATQQYDNPLLWTITNWQQPAEFADSKHPQEHTRMWSSALCKKC